LSRLVRMQPVQPDSKTLKVTIAGRTFMHVLTTFHTGNAEQIRRFIERNFAARVLRDHPADEILADWMDLYHETEGLMIHKVFSTQRFSGHLVLKARKTGQLYLARLQVDDLPPHGILEFLIEPRPEV
jgi:hypothetical protein